MPDTKTANFFLKHVAIIAILLLTLFDSWTPLSPLMWCVSSCIWLLLKPLSTYSSTEASKGFQCASMG